MIEKDAYLGSEIEKIFNTYDISNAGMKSMFWEKLYSYKLKTNGFEGLTLEGESYFPAKGDIVKISTNRYGKIRYLWPIYCADSGVMTTEDKAGAGLPDI